MDNLPPAMCSDEELVKRVVAARMLGVFRHSLDRSIDLKYKGKVACSYTRLIGHPEDDDIESSTTILCCNYRLLVSESYDLDRILIDLYRFASVTEYKYAGSVWITWAEYNQLQKLSDVEFFKGIVRRFLRKCKRQTS